MATPLTILTNIKERVKSILFNDLKGKVSDDFAQGYRYCYNAFQIAFEKDKSLDTIIEHYNTKVLLKRQEKLEKVLRLQRERINELNSVLYSKGGGITVKREATIEHITLGVLKDLGKLGVNVPKEVLKQIVNNRIKERVK